VVRLIVERRRFAAVCSSPRWRGALAVAVAGYAAISLAVGTRNAVHGATGGQDLAPVYRASRSWLHGANPYQPPSDEQWRAITGLGTAPPIIVPVAYATPYSPVALLDVAPVAALEWHRARVAWLGVNLFLAALIPFVIRQLWYPDWTPFQLALFCGLWLSGLGLRVGLGLGQHQLVVLAAFLLGLRWLRGGGTVMPGVLFALTLHKFTWSGVFVPLLIARRNYRAVAQMALATALLLALFFARIHAPLVDVVDAYVAELGWWWHQSEALGGPGHGPFHLFPVLQALLPGRALARVVMYGLVVAGGVVQFLLARRHGGRPEDLTVAGFILLALWSTYHGVYDGVFAIVPLCVVLRYATASGPGPRRRLSAVAAVAMLGLWLADPLKIGLLMYRVPIDQVPVDAPAVRIVSLAYRAIPFVCFWLLAAILWTSPVEERPRGQERPASLRGRASSLAGDRIGAG
jgi:hypothetical protein